MCSGMLRKGGKCTKRAIDNPDSGMMPTCKIHREQLKVSGWCRALLPCGFECGRRFEWKPHGFQLCPTHRDNITTCRFLKIPQEMRVRVYQFLLPNKHIPARYAGSNRLRTDGQKVYTAILRVNRQIHDEAAALLYSTRVFSIELCGTGLSMCNTLLQPGFAEIGAQPLLDYQMQLMLLEQQNKRRLLMARQEQAILNGQPSSTQTSEFRSIQRPIRSPFPYANGPMGNVWQTPLSDRYFNMIRSFLIESVIPSLRGPISAGHTRHGPPKADAATSKILEVRLYDYCDHLHRVIGRLQLIQRPIAHLQIIIKFCDTYTKREEALSAAQFLLQPFRRLHNVTTPKVLSLTMGAFPDRVTELLIPDWTPAAAGATTSFTNYLNRWSRDLSSPQPSFQSQGVFEAYWKLEKLTSSIKGHHYDAEPVFDQFTDLLHFARIAREANDLAHFQKIWDRVVQIWLEYLSNQKDYHIIVARSIKDIDNIVGNGALMMGPGRMVGG